MEEWSVAGGGALCTGFPPFCLLLYSTLVDVNQTKTHVAAPEDVTSSIHLNRFTGWMERNTGSCDAGCSVTAPSTFSWGLIISMIITRSTVKGSSSKLCVCVFFSFPAVWGVLWAVQSVGVQTGHHPLLRPLWSSFGGDHLAEHYREWTGGFFLSHFQRYDDSAYGQDEGPWTGVCWLAALLPRPWVPWSWSMQV